MKALKRKRRTHGRAKAAARRAGSVATARGVGPLGLRLHANHSLLLIVDVHERLVPAIEQATRVIENCSRLIRGAARLGVPVLMTEHCPERLGPALEAIRVLVPRSNTISKTHFAAADEPQVIQRLAGLSRAQIVIAGLEAHVCVLQTALALAERGYRVYVVADAIGARRESSRQAAISRLQSANVTVITTEMALFEWLEHAERAEFRELLSIIK
jgi:nicotinamidase-related amidase